MKRMLCSTILCITCVVFVVGGTFAKKKPEKPVLERFEATISPATGPGSVSIAVEEFSTDEGVQDLAQAFAKGGEDSLESSLDKVKKGFYQLENSSAMSIGLIQVKPEGGGRRLTCIGEASDRFQGSLGGSVSIGHRGYPFTFIEIEVDEQGNGKGLIIPFAKVTFNKQGQMEVNPMAAGTGSHASLQLVNVHLVK